MIFSDGMFIVQKLGEVVSNALRQSITEDVLIEKISALGNTPFVLDHVVVDLDEHVFVSMSEIKRIRRELT